MGPRAGRSSGRRHASRRPARAQVDTRSRAGIHLVYVAPIYLNIRRARRCAAKSGAPARARQIQIDGAKWVGGPAPGLQGERAPGAAPRPARAPANNGRTKYDDVGQFCSGRQISGIKIRIMIIDDSFGKLVGGRGPRAPGQGARADI